MKQIAWVAAGLVWAAACVASPQPGSRDPSFDAGLGTNDSVYDLVFQTDGRIVIVGSLTGTNGLKRFNVARLNPEGGRDAGFQVGTGVSGPVIDSVDQSFLFRVALGADGKIVVSGVFTRINGVDRNNIARLNSDGTVDTTFHPPSLTRTGFPYAWVYAAAIDQDGRILIGGDFTRVNGLSRNYLVRLDANGSLDNSFNASFDADALAPDGNVSGIILQADGRILVRGTFSKVRGVESSALVRLNPDSSLDAVAAVSPDLALAVKTSRKSFGLFGDFFGVEADGRILTGQSDPVLGVNRLVRKTADGQVDDGFNFIPGAGPPGSVVALALQIDGKILAAGSGLVRLFSGDATPVAPVISQQPQSTAVNEFRNGAFSVQSYGFPKPTYQWRFNGVAIPGETNAGLAVLKARLTNSGLYAVVISNSVDRVISEPASLTVIPAPTAPGFLDLNFDPKVALSDLYSFIRTVVVQRDDKVLIAAPDLFRVDADGRIDPDFNLRMSSTAQISDVALQDDDRILICGIFTNVNGVARNRIARLRPDGSLDASFNPGEGVGGTTPNISSLALHTNGQVFIAGTFTSVNGVTRSGVARLNANGGLDSGFDPGDLTPASVTSMKVQRDGRAIIVGEFTTINGVSRPGLARLRADGSLDTDFLPAVTVRTAVDLFDVPQGLVLQPDGKIWLAGDFGTVDGQEGVNLVRLRSDGSVDVKLSRPVANFGLIPSHFSLALQIDGRLLVSSRFSPLVRLDPDGTVDLNFQVPAFTRNFSLRWPMFIALGSDGQVMVAGDFTTVAGWPRPGLAQLHGGDLPRFVAGSMRLSGTGQFEFQLTANPDQVAVIEATTTLIPAEWIPILTNSVGAGPLSLTDTQAVSYPTRFYRVRVSP